jgi:hypothetical protein
MKLYQGANGILIKDSKIQGDAGAGLSSLDFVAANTGVGTNMYFQLVYKGKIYIMAGANIYKVDPDTLALEDTINLPTVTGVANARANYNCAMNGSYLYTDGASGILTKINLDNTADNATINAVGANASWTSIYACAICNGYAYYKPFASSLDYSYTIRVPLSSWVVGSLATQTNVGRYYGGCIYSYDTNIYMAPTVGYSVGLNKFVKIATGTGTATYSPTYASVVGLAEGLLASDGYVHHMSIQYFNNYFYNINSSIFSPYYQWVTRFKKDDFATNDEYQVTGRLYQGFMQTVVFRGKLYCAPHQYYTGSNTNSGLMYVLDLTNWKGSGWVTTKNWESTNSNYKGFFGISQWNGYIFMNTNTILIKFKA